MTESGVMETGALPAEQRYLQLFFDLQLAQWQNYAEDAERNLTAIDDAIYTCLLAVGESTALTGREAAIWRSIRQRGLVDKQPAVSRLRNRLDDWDNYSPGLPPVGGAPTERRLLLAATMQPDVLELMQLRSSLARQMGYASYPELVLQAEELDLQGTRRLVSAYLEQHLGPARELVRELQINWSSWFTDLSRLGQMPVVAEAEALAAHLLGRLGLADALPRLDWRVNSDGLAGYTGVLEPGRDVRILIRPIRSLEELRTFCHELGHACCHALNVATGLCQTWTASYDEAMAVLLEQIGLRLLLPEAALEQAGQIGLLENVRCAISFLFELDLWEQPEQADTLYRQHYGQLVPDVGNPLLWALDSFRSIDPLYIQNYVLGAVIAEKVMNRLEQVHGRDYRLWGQELRALFVDGRGRSLRSKLFDAGVEV